MSIPTRQEILFRNKTIILVLYFILACILPECNDFHRTIVKFPKIIQVVITEKGAFLLERRLTENDCIKMNASFIAPRTMAPEQNLVPSF